MTVQRSAVLQALLAVLSLCSFAAEPLAAAAMPKEATQQLEAARKFIAARDWKRAVAVLQDLIDREVDDVYQVAGKSPTGRPLIRLESTRAESIRLLESLPHEGRKQYEDTYGAEAATLLTKARVERDAPRYAQVGFYLQLLRRFSATQAGIEATKAAAEHHTQYHDLLLARYLYERLLQRQSLGEWSDTALFHAAFALRGSKRPAEGVVAKELFKRFKMEGKELAEELNRRVKQMPLAWKARSTVNDSPGLHKGGTPILERLAAMDLLETEPGIRKQLTALVANMNRSGQPILPASIPLGASLTRTSDGRRIPMVVYRTQIGLDAYDLARKKIHWKTPMDESLVKLLAYSTTTTAVNQWLDFFDHGKRPSIVFENSTIGTFSTNGTLVYAIDDLAVPPPANEDLTPEMARIRSINIVDNLNTAINSSKLRAYELVSGKLIWEQGNKAETRQDKELFDSYFLGPPLPWEERLYALIEKGQVFRLVSLEASTGKLLSTQPLAYAPTNLATDPLRRVEAVHLVAGSGVLVCPTNAGTIFGVDLATGALLWSYAYVADLAPDFVGPIQPRYRFDPKKIPSGLWKAAAPVIVDGKVVFTAPDADAVHCVNVRDGTAVWTHKRQDDDLYFAGIEKGIGLIVGKKSVRGINLAKGTTVWTLATGSPSGRGTFGQDGRYYLPLATSKKERKPGIAVIEVATGALKSVVGSPKNEVPGNLLFFDGVLISQTTTELVVYPLAK